MDVLFLSPSYPPEMAEYVRGLAEVGARVWGVGDSPAAALPPTARRYLSAYLPVPSLLQEGSLVEHVLDWLRRERADIARVEALWEPLVLAAARLRERLGVPGMSVDTVLGFRDKEVMKARLRAAGLRVPRSARAHTVAQVRQAASDIGYPLIIKPIAGAGSADTYRVHDDAQLATAVSRTAHVPEVSVEEFVEGEEFTYDTICIHGRPAFENVAQYLPRPLEARTLEWVSPIIVTVRDLDMPKLQPGLELGRAALRALRMGTGFTHMEWYLTAEGEAVFGEVGCRPGGAHLVDQMNYTCDVDLFREWARAVCHGTFEAHAPRLYNCAIVFKRARGEGRIVSIEGLSELLAEHHDHVIWENLLPVGSPRRDWKRTLLSDGFLILRHPEWDDAIRLAKAVATDVRMTARPE